MRRAMSLTTTAQIAGAGAGPSETGDVTIVVATHNRPDRLAETMRHHHAPVIVVDNGSDEPLDLPGADVVRLDANVGAAARNIGVERARTPYVAFADDDSYWEPGALAAAAAMLRAHPRTALLAAEVRAGREGRLDPVSSQMAAAPLGTPPGAAGPAILGFLACSVVVRRDAFLAAGGFRPRLFMYGEEALLAMDLAAAGWRLSYAPSLLVRHFPEPTGRNPRTRHRLETRNRVLTALLRRPPHVVAQALADALGRHPAALLDVARDLPWALRNRRSLPAEVEQALRKLR
jgi:N-acetylglucosaminyl-diphospho-decaprenol L-rhamnosyltransferase